MTSVLLLASALAADPVLPPLHYAQAAPETVYVERTVQPQASAQPAKKSGSAPSRIIGFAALAGAVFMVAHGLDNPELSYVTSSGSDDYYTERTNKLVYIGAATAVFGLVLVIAN